MRELEKPLNTEERFLHAISVRLEVLIEQVSSIVEHLATQSNISTEDGVVEQIINVNDDMEKIANSYANKPITEYTNAELKSLLDHMGVKYPNRATKAELIALIEE